MGAETPKKSGVKAPGNGKHEDNRQVRRENIRQVRKQQKSQALKDQAMRCVGTSGRKYQAGQA